MASYDTTHAQEQAVSNFAQDMAVKQAWGLTLTEWNRLSEHDRRDRRDRVTEADHFNQENQ